MSRTTENQIAFAILQIASRNPNGIATFNQCYSDVPKYINLTAEDCAPSTTRPGELMWHQQVRNIKSHDKDDGNFIKEKLLVHVDPPGYQITEKGIILLRQS
ncbi:hypothetical protein [Nitrospirillum viridazoti]|uniref:hypothetical protein n=1 Tax=Nitrospirillum viridazoti TaxID=3144925 RepID=UPI00110F8353|nr:hypothetical protein [Nitrospirillum amazonense]